MFVYSFLEKNLACAILFDTVRLLFFEVPRLSFFDIPKKQNCCIIAFQLFVTISLSPHSFTNFSDDWCGSHSVLLTFRSFFWPVRLFHHVRLLIFGESLALIISYCSFIRYSRVPKGNYGIFSFEFWIDGKLSKLGNRFSNEVI